MNENNEITEFKDEIFMSEGAEKLVLEEDHKMVDLKNNLYSSLANITKSLFEQKEEVDKTKEWSLGKYYSLKIQ